MFRYCTDCKSMFVFNDIVVKMQEIVSRVDCKHFPELKTPWRYQEDKHFYAIVLIAIATTGSKSKELNQPNLVSWLWLCEDYHTFSIETLPPPPLSNFLGVQVFLYILYILGSECA